MKHFLTCIFLFCLHWANAQNLISNINISMPAQMPASTADWHSNLPPVSITVQVRPDAKRAIPASIIESKILVTIKNGDSKICGSFTPATAPNAGFNSLVKIWRGAEVDQLLGQPCMLKPGSYILSVQFFDGKAQVLSEESRKPFTVVESPGSAINTFQPPQAIAPAEGKILSANEAKLPITFKWTPIVPKPKDLVTYTVSVIEIRKGEFGSSGNNTLYESAGLTNLTQLIIPNADIKTAWPIASGSKYGWYVKATNKEGREYGRSEVNKFSVAAGSYNKALLAAGCQMDFTIISSSCEKDPATGKTYYKFCANLKDISTVTGTSMYFNDPLTFNCVNGTLTGCSAVALTDLIKSPNGAINYLGTYPNIIPKIGTGATVCFNFTPTIAGATTATFKAFSVCATGSGTAAQASGSATPDTLVRLPDCPCTYCDQFKEWNFEKDDVTTTNSPATAATSATYMVNVSTTISGPNVNIKSFKAELISFIHNGKEECFGCNKDAQTFGNFTGGTFGSWGNGVFPLSGSNTTHHTLSWFGASGATIPLAGQAINLQFTAPPFSNLSCCDDEIKFCIRYSFTNADCQTCSFVKCYSVTRKTSVK